MYTAIWCKRVILTSLFGAVGFGSIGALQAQTLPLNPVVVSGDLSFAGTATTLDVTQTSDTGIINWESFSIGTGNTVSFDNGTGSTLNRVTGTQLSEIYGTLAATGSLYLVNENGVVFGANGVVNTGGDFVVSTLDVSDVDYLNGGSLEFTGNAAVNIRNYGSLFSANGDIAIISREVINEGSVIAPNGRASLIAGRDVLMRDSSVDDGRFLVRIGHATDAIFEQGIVEAAEVELATNGGNIYALAGNNSGHIQATGVANRGGRVFLTARSGSIQVSKTVRVRKSNGDGGAINLAAANFTVDGTLDASSNTGLGGIVDLLAEVDATYTGTTLAYGGGSPGSGGTVSVSGLGSIIFSGLADTGGGVLIIDPADIEINANTTAGSPALIGASEINTATLVTNLASGNVVIDTGAAGTAAGTIHVADDVIYNSAFDLTLLANGDIHTFGDIINTNASGGDINLIAGWDGSAFSSGVYDALDLATQTSFGASTGVTYSFGSGPLGGSGAIAATGSVYIGNNSQFSSVEVGARAGDTNVYGNDIFVVGSSQFVAAHTHLGFQATDQGAGYNVSGDINVRATGSVNVFGGGIQDSYAMIGNGGADFSVNPIIDATVSGDIEIEALAAISVLGGSTTDTYAMIGHGGTFFTGDRSGDITLETGASLQVEGAADGSGSYGHVGHGGFDADGNLSGDISVTAANNVSVLGGIAFSYAQIGHGGLNTDGNMSGDLSIVADGDLNQLGGAAQDAYSGVGHGDMTFSSSGTRQGGLLVDILGEYSLEDGPSSMVDLSFADFGHFTTTAGGVSNAAATIIAHSFDNDTGSAVATGGTSTVDLEFVAVGVDFGDVFFELTGSSIAFTGPPVISNGPFSATAISAYDISIDSGLTFTNLGSGDIIFAAGGDFNNNSGSLTPLTTGGRWLVYSTRPDQNVQDIEITNRNFLLYNTSFNPADPIPTTLPAGNGLIYSVQPTVTATGAQTIVYGNAVATPVAMPGIVVSVGGIAVTAADFDISTSSYGATAALATGLPTSASGNTNVGTYAAGLVLTPTVTGPVHGGVATATATDSLTVTPRTLNLTIGADDKLFDGNTAATLNFGSDAIVGDSLAYSGTGTFASSAVGTGIPVNYSGVAVGGADASNYTLVTPTSGTTSANILPAQFDITPDPFLPIAPPPQNQFAAPGSSNSSMQFLSTGATRSIVDDLSDGAEFCREVANNAYAVDCMADRLAEAARSLPNTGAYAETKAALADAANKLEALAQQNRSDNLPPRVVQSRSLGQSSSRRLIPTRSANTASIVAQATAILVEAETRLLRAAENSQRRQVQFQQIAAAVGSNKVLLRSL